MLFTPNGFILVERAGAIPRNGITSLNMEHETVEHEQPNDVEPVSKDSSYRFSLGKR
jgi:hypothetical protein